MPGSGERLARRFQAVPGPPPGRGQQRGVQQCSGERTCLDWFACAKLGAGRIQGLGRRPGLAWLIASRALRDVTKFVRIALPQQATQPAQADRIGATERPGQQVRGDIFGQPMGVKGAANQPEQRAGRRIVSQRKLISGHRDGDARARQRPLQPWYLTDCGAH